MRRPLPLLALCLAACGPGPEAPAPPPAPAPPAATAQTPSPEPAAPADPRVARARAALLPLKTRLKAALTEAMSDGVSAAIGACRDQAPRIAAEISASGVTVGRTSHRLRNPSNAPAPWMEPLLAKYEKGASAPWLTADLPDGSLGYVEPIGTAGMCLSCHGETLAPTVSARLAELYPEDRATGFAEGEFRGLFWAVVPPQS